ASLTGDPLFPTLCTLERQHIAASQPKRTHHWPSVGTFGGTALSQTEHIRPSGPASREIILEPPMARARARRVEPPEKQPAVYDEALLMSACATARGAPEHA